MGEPNGTRQAGAVVIVGGGLAGFSAAVELRRLGHVDSITIVDSEPGSYDRPPLSKELFKPEFGLQRLTFASPEQMAGWRISTRYRRHVVALDPNPPSVTLDDGSRLPADTVLLATGGRPRRLGIPGADRPEVHVLRTLHDALAIRAEVRRGTRVAVIGAGLIGAEVAASMKQAGARVALIDPVSVPLEPAVGTFLARHLHEMHRLAGIELFHDITAAIEKADAGIEVVLDGGQRVVADVVIAGIGILPNSGLAADAGIEVADGVIVDARYRTSAPNVFAAGDVAVHRSDDGTMARREEHWEAAQLSGQHAAHGMLGLPVPHRGPAWFWTDRHDSHVEVVGRMSGAGVSVVRDHADGRLAAFQIFEDRIVGAASVNDGNTVRAARRMIEQGVQVDIDMLSDASVPIRSLLKAMG